MKKISILLVSILVSAFVFAQSNNMKSAQDVLQDRGEVYFKFAIDEGELMKDNISFLSSIISIDNVRGSEITAYANENGFDRFLELNIDYEVLTPPSMLYKSILENASSSRNTEELDYYPAWDEYISIMNQFATDYPDLCEVVNIGYSMNDREILFIHINDSLGLIQNEPEFMYTSSMHGDELVGYFLMLRYIEHLLENYGIDPEITNLVNNIDIWINPLANPDGTFAGGNNSVWGATRFNANNVDLNRNYADPEDGPHPDGNPYQVETEIFMDFAEGHNLVMSANMHGGSEVINYPWDTWAQLAADDDWWYYVSRQYADTVQAYGPAGYLTDYDNGITNGYAWYSISGGRQDYMNYFHNCREVTMELSQVKTPPESQLPGFWEYNYRSLFHYMQQSLYGFSGVVTNAMNGNPVLAKVFIENHDIDNSWIYSQLPTGNYHRLVKAGTYDVTFSAFGYYDQTIEDVVIVDGANLELNVELIPNSPVIADFSASTSVTGTGNDIDFFDNSWGNNLTSWNWTFEGGTPSSSTDENPVGIVYENTGVYDVTLLVSNADGDSDTKYMEDYIIVKESFNMSDESITTCDALFYDTGGEESNYSDNEEFTMTFLPGEPNSLVKMEFLEFNIENHFDCNFDYVEIFDGVDVNAPRIGKWCGTNSPGTVIAGTEEGALTVYFYSNSSVTLSGWKALISCDSNVGVQQIEKPMFSIFPNPSNSEINISFVGEIENIVLCDMHGRVLYKTHFAKGGLSVDVTNYEQGVYLLSFMYNGEPVTRKVLVN